MKKRRTIVFLVNDIDVSYSNLVYLMTKKAAENMTATLLFMKADLSTILPWQTASIKYPTALLTIPVWTE